MTVTVTATAFPISSAANAPVTSAICNAVAAIKNFNKRVIWSVLPWQKLAQSRDRVNFALPKLGGDNRTLSWPFRVLLPLKKDLAR